MKLSRSNALLLVGTIAAAGCVVDNNGGDGSAGQAGDGSSGKGGSGGTGAAGKGNAGTTSSSSGKGGGGNAGTGSAGKGSAGKGSAGTTSQSAGGAGGDNGGESGQGQAGQMSAAGAGGQGGSAECNDDDAPQLTCGGLDTAACDIKDFLDGECAMTWKNMKPAISNVARNCMLELSQDQLCNDATNVYHCVDQALQEACPDETVATPCAQIVGNCPGTEDSCNTYLSGLTSTGRDEMVSCMESYCDFYSCAESLN
jgi:hypothetical protein